LEIELKLLLEPANHARIGRSGALSQSRRGRAVTAKLHTIYYDTPDRLLWRDGVALRLRRAGGHWIQTVKGAGGEIGGLHQREEFEWPVARGVLDLELLASSPFARLFSRSRVRTGLAPVFETVFRRRTIDLALSGGTRALLCLDQGEIHAGSATEAICEAEVELVQGDADALLAFAQNLLVDIPFRIGTRSKAERGYALALAQGTRRPVLAAPVHATLVDLAAGAGAAEAFSAIVQSVAAQVHGNERGFLARGDRENLHQMRIGLRRLRVALALPRGEDWEARSRPLRDRLRELSRQLGEVRNWDVFTVETLRPLSAHIGAAQLASLRARSARRRALALSEARSALRDRRYTQLWLELARLMLSHPLQSREARGQGQAGVAQGAQQAGATDRRARDFAAEALSRRLHGMSARAAQVTGAAGLHELRIAAKKLRYTCEFFAALYPRKKVKRFLEKLEALQDVLGALNDAAIGSLLVGRASAGATPLDAHASGLALGWIAAGAARARAGVDKKIRAPLETQVYWK